MAQKTRIFKILDDSIPAGMDLWTSAPIPNGKRVTLKLFGACAGNDESKAAIQWGEGSNWTTLRACSNWEFQINEVFTGDGTKRFRIVRDNQSGGPKVIVAWADGIIHDQ